MTWSDVILMAIIATLIALYAYQARQWNRSEEYRKVGWIGLLLIATFYYYLYQL